MDKGNCTGRTIITVIITHYASMFQYQPYDLLYHFVNCIVPPSGALKYEFIVFYRNINSGPHRGLQPFCFVFVFLLCVPSSSLLCLT